MAIKKKELLRRLEKVEYDWMFMLNKLDKHIETVNTNTDRIEYVLRFLADKLGYMITEKDVIKINRGVKSIVTEIEMVEIPQELETWKSVFSATRSGDCCEPKPKPKRKYNKKTLLKRSR